MNAKERFNNLIQAIEEQVQHPYLTAQEIADNVASQNALCYRDMSTVMKFLSDYPLIEYIKERRMMAAYRFLVTSECADKRKVAKATEISGLGTSSSFSHKFRNMFGVTPTVAAENKDMSLFVPPLDWDAISCKTEAPLAAEEEGEQMKKKSIFGIPKEQYDRLIEATDLAEFYGLESEKSNLAFELSDTLGEPLKDTFQYISELLEFGYELQEAAEDRESGNPEAFVDTARDPVIQFLFFNCNLHIDSAYEVIDRLGISDTDIMAKDPLAIHIFATIPDVRFSFVEDALAYYRSHANDDYDDMEFDKYIDRVAAGTPKEEAFDALIPMGNLEVDDYYPDQDDMGEDPFEEQMLENDRWHGKRIDIEGDPDNATYDDEY